MVWSGFAPFRRVRSLLISESLVARLLPILASLLASHHRRAEVLDAGAERGEHCLYGRDSFGVVGAHVEDPFVAMVMNGPRGKGAAVSLEGYKLSELAFNCGRGTEDKPQSVFIDHAVGARTLTESEPAALALG